MDILLPDESIGFPEESVVTVTEATVHAILSVKEILLLNALKIVLPLIEGYDYAYENDKRYDYLRNASSPVILDNVMTQGEYKFQEKQKSLKKQNHLASP